MYFSTFIQALISKAELVATRILLNHWQKIYIYYFFIFPNNYFTKKILPISFQNGDAATIREEK